MEWTAVLTALGGVNAFPAYGLLALVAYLIFTGKLMPSSAAVREIERAQRNADREAERIAADRDARLESKNAEIERLTAAHDAEVDRAREAEVQWRDAWRESQNIAAEVREQNRDLIESLYFVRKIVGALPRAEGGDES